MNKVFTPEKLRLYFWMSLIFFLLTFFHTLSTYPEKFLFVLLNNLWALVFTTVVNFILFEYTVPSVLRKKQSIIYNVLLGIFYLFIYMMIYSYGAYGWRLLGIELNVYHRLGASPSVDKILENNMAYSMGGVFLFGIIRHIYNYTRLKQSTQQLRIEKQQAELNYLKSQTNPHFLFNTLNNIYSLAKDKSDLAPESILRISKILRYMLYETSGEYISVEQELKIINDYIELEKLRYDETLRINFNHDIEDMKQALPPLLLVPLVENAFKHGVSETRMRPFVDIHLSIKNRQLNFEIKNSTEKTLFDPTVKENIGLKNLRRQLELLYKEYDLSIRQADSSFTATLKINLASHV
jgi:sensor histidine kinase YesM